TLQEVEEDEVAAVLYRYGRGGHVLRAQHRRRGQYRVPDAVLLRRAKETGSGKIRTVAAQCAARKDRRKTEGRAAEYCRLFRGSQHPVRRCGGVHSALEVN